MVGYVEQITFFFKYIDNLKDESEREKNDKKRMSKKRLEKSGGGRRKRK